MSWQAAAAGTEDSVSGCPVIHSATACRWLADRASPCARIRPTSSAFTMDRGDMPDRLEKPGARLGPTLP